MPVLVPVLQAVALTVPFQVVLAAEGLGTRGAPVRPVTGMSPLMVQAVGRVLAAVAAEPALVTFWCPECKARLLGGCTAWHTVSQCDSLP